MVDSVVHTGSVCLLTSILDSVVDSVVDENEGWKALMQIRRIGLSIDLKINPMVDAEVD